MIEGTAIIKQNQVNQKEKKKKFKKVFNVQYSCV